MEAGNYDAIVRLQRDNWWYRSRRDLLRRSLARHGPFSRGLEVGCGTGANLPILAGLCRQLVATDFHPAALERISGHARGSASSSRLATADIRALPFSGGTFDLIVCCDVLEHVEDQEAASELERVIAPGGLLLATVPAHRHLWNENDDFSHHLRRYRRADLRRLLHRFELVELSYWNLLMYLPTLGYCALRRIIGPGTRKNNLERIPAIANQPLALLSLLENRVREWLPAPTGTSLLAVARRR